MTADYSDDTKNLKLVRIFNFFDCSNQTGTTLIIETRYFDYVKCILKQMQCRIYDRIESQKAPVSKIATAPFGIELQLFSY